MRAHLLSCCLVLLSVACGTQEDAGAKPAPVVTPKPATKTPEMCTAARAQAQSAAELRMTFVHATEGPAELEQTLFQKRVEQARGKPDEAGAKAALAAAGVAVTTAKQAVTELESCIAAIKTSGTDRRAKCAAADTTLAALLAAQRQVATAVDAANVSAEDAQGIKGLITNGEDAWKVVGEPGPLAALVTAYDGCAF